MVRWTFFSCLAIAVAFNGMLLQAEDIPLHVAVQNGFVDVKVTGRGASSGDSVQVSVKRTAKAPRNISVIVEPGTVIKSTSGKVQSMALNGVKCEVKGRSYLPATKIEVTSSPRTFILEGFCRDFKMPTPQTSDSFSIAAPDPMNAQILVRAKSLGTSIKVTQSALWIKANGASDEELKERFKASKEEIEAAHQLLVAVEDPAKEEEIKLKLDDISSLITDIRDAVLDAQQNRGKTAVVSKEGVSLMTTPISQVEIPKGTEVTVMGGFGGRFMVKAEVDGRILLGRIDGDALSMNEKDKDAPATSQIFRPIDTGQFRLNVLDKVKVNVGGGSVRVNVGN